MDTRFHFVRNYAEDKIIKIRFVILEDYDADMFTKIVPENLFNKYTEKFISQEFN